MRERAIKGAARAWFLLLCGLCLLLAWPGLAVESAKPALELQRSVSKQYVGAGDSTVLTYRVENTGNVALEDVVITDAICGRIGSEQRLEPGEYRSFQVSVAVTKECQSEPEVTWSYGGMRHERTLEPVSLAPAVNALKLALATASSQARAGENVCMTLYLTNEGNTTIADIALRDSALGELGGIGRSIAPGETLEWPLQSSMTGTAVHCISATGRTSSDETVCAISNEVTVTLVQSAAQAQLSIQARAVQGESENGGALVEITLENTSDADIANVTISERTRGEIRTLACIAPGVTTLKVECPADESAQAQFLAQFSARDGSNTTVLSAQISLQSAANARTVLQSGPVRLGTSAYAVFMYGGLFVLFVLLASIVLQRARRRHRKRLAREKRARRMRVLRRNARMNEEEWVQTRPHRAVSQEEAKL